MGSSAVSSPLSSALERALTTAKAKIVLDAVKSAPGATTIQELMKSLKAHGLEDAFLGATLGDLRGGQAADVVDDDADDADSETVEQKPRTAPTANRNLRGSDERQRLDGEIEAVLRKAGRMKAEKLRAEVGGTSVQARESLKRLMGLGHVRTEGERRATTYIWASW